jgi:N-dimethylarginine dimethylaminohydrolase
LKDPYFYHIDTCLAILAPDAAIYYPGAFDDDGVAVIKKFFPRLVEATEDDARNRLACNCFSPDGENVVLHAGSRETNKRLRAAGFTPVEVDVSEFLKGGGSVCCMKMFTW